VDDLDQCEIGQLILASEELALRSAAARYNMERASARLASLLDQIDVQHSVVLAMLQSGAPDNQESTPVAPSVPGRW
jgi:hypothetical protein